MVAQTSQENVKSAQEWRVKHLNCTQCARQQLPSKSYAALCAATCSEALQAVCFEQQGVVAQQALLLAELHELFCWAEPPEETPRQSVPRRCIKTTLLPEATRIKTCECVHARARQRSIPCLEVLAPLVLLLAVDRSTWLLPLPQQPLLAFRTTPMHACR